MSIGTAGLIIALGVVMIVGVIYLYDKNTKKHHPQH